jgi:hypothetical protein
VPASSVTAADVDLPADAPVLGPPRVTPVGVAASLIGFGVAIGAGSVSLLRRRQPDRHG